MNSKFLMVSLLVASSVVASDTFEFANIEQTMTSDEANPLSTFTRKLFQGYDATMQESAQISAQRAVVAKEAAAKETARLRAIDAENAKALEASKPKEKSKVVSSRFAMAKKAIVGNPRTSAAVAAVCVIALSTAIYKIVQAKKAKKQAFLEAVEENLEVVI